MARVPHNTDAERAILSCMMSSERALAQAVHDLDGPEFYSIRHSDMFKAMAELFNEGTVVEPIALADRLTRHGTFESSGGYQYIADLVDFAEGDSGIEGWIESVTSNYTLRRLGDTCRQIETAILEGKLPPSELIHMAQSQVYEVTNSVSMSELKDSSVILSDVLDRLHERVNSGGEIPGVQTGFSKLDSLTGGLREGELIIVAGRPGTGKTSFALNMALNASVRHGRGVALFSLEMSERELVERMICTQGSVDSQRVKIGKLDDDEFKRIATASGLVNRAPLFINDSPVITVPQIRANLMKQMADRPVDLVVVDYLQLMEAKGFSNREGEVSSMSRGLKVIAREFDIPVVAVAQLNRESEKRANPRPQLSDLRESGSIEQDADMVMFLFREEMYTGSRNRKGEDVTGKAELLLRKQRNGPIGYINLMFEAQYTRFYEQEKIANASEMSYSQIDEVEEELPFKI